MPIAVTTQTSQIRDAILSRSPTDITNELATLLYSQLALDLTTLSEEVCTEYVVNRYASALAAISVQQQLAHLYAKLDGVESQLANIAMRLKR